MTKGQIIGKTHWKIKRVEGLALPNRKRSMQKEKPDLRQLIENYKNRTLPESKEIPLGSSCSSKHNVPQHPFQLGRATWLVLANEIWAVVSFYDFKPFYGLRSWYAFSNLFFFNLPARYRWLQCPSRWWRHKKKKRKKSLELYIINWRKTLT